MVRRRRFQAVQHGFRHRSAAAAAPRREKGIPPAQAPSPTAAAAAGADGLERIQLPTTTAAAEPQGFGPGADAG